MTCDGVCVSQTDMEDMQHGLCSYEENGKVWDGVSSCKMSIQGRVIQCQAAWQLHFLPTHAPLLTVCCAHGHASYLHVPHIHMYVH